MGRSAVAAATSGLRHSGGAEDSGHQSSHEERVAPVRPLWAATAAVTISDKWLLVAAAAHL